MDLFSKEQCEPHILREHPCLSLSDLLSPHLMEFFAPKKYLSEQAQGNNYILNPDSVGPPHVFHVFCSTLSDIMNLWPPENFLPGLGCRTPVGRPDSPQQP